MGTPIGDLSLLPADWTGGKPEMGKPQGDQGYGFIADRQAFY